NDWFLFQAASWAPPDCFCGHRFATGTCARSKNPERIPIGMRSRSAPQESVPDSRPVSCPGRLPCCHECHNGMRGRTDRMPGLAGLPRTILATLALAVAPFALATVSADPLPAWQLAQAPAQKPEMMENCPGLVASQRP